MKRKKLALLLAVSLTVTSFSGMGLTAYAEELPEIVEETVDEEQMNESAEVYEEEKPAVDEVAVAADIGTEADVAESPSPDTDETEATALYGDFVESVEVVDEADAPAVYMEADEGDDAGFEVKRRYQTLYVQPGQDITVTMEVDTKVPLSYQWYVEAEEGWGKIENATNEEYPLANVVNNIRLKCVVTNPANGKTDDTVYNIRIDSGLLIGSYTDELYVEPGEEGVLSVFASTEYGELQYRWYAGDDEEHLNCLSEEAQCKVPAERKRYVCAVSDGYTEEEVECVVRVDSGLQVKSESKEYSAKVGDRVVLSVEASTRSGELHYQWYKEGDDGEEEIKGANGAEYELTVEDEYPADYSCIVWDDYDNYRSVEHVIKVDADEEPDEDHSDWWDEECTVTLYVALNDTANLSEDIPVQSEGLRYQWYREDTDENRELIKGADESTLNIQNVTKDEKYICVISNGEKKKEVVYEIKLDTGFYVEDVVHYKYIRPGEQIKLSIGAYTGTGELTYEWYKDGGDEEDILLGREASITVDEPDYYYCKVSNGYETEYVGYRVYPDVKLEFTSQGGDVKVAAGQAVTLDATAKTNYGTVLYQWYKNETELYGQTKPVLETLPVTQKGRYDEYVCEIQSYVNGKYYSIFDEKITFLVSMETGKKGLILEAPNHVGAAYGDPVEVKVSARSDEGALSYIWYVERNCEDQFLSKGDTLQLGAVTKTELYRCKVSDGIQTKWANVMVGPSEQVNLLAESKKYAKSIGSDGSPSTAYFIEGSTAWWSFTPNRTGRWSIYCSSGSEFSIWRSNGRFLGDNVSDLENKVTVDLQAGETYYVVCYSDSMIRGEVTLEAMYLDGDSHEHSWDAGMITKQPTCGTAGERIYTCSVCKETYTEEIPATGAHMMVTVTDRAATCGAAGSQHCECTVCHTREAEMVIPATGAHTMVTVTDRAATCGAAGSQHRECTVCHTKEAETVIPATGSHQFGAYVVTKQPTVLAAGVQTRTCAVCHTTESAEIARLNGVIHLTTKKLPLQVKKNVQLSRILKDLAAGDSIVSCVSSNPKVATVDNSGKVVGKSAGKTNVTITLASGVSDTVTIVVQKKKVAASGISNVSKSLKLKLGEKYTLAPVISPITTADKVSYSSSNKKVVTVSKKGVITAKKSGTAKITVKAGKKKVTVKVTVEKVAPTGMNKVPESKTLKKGKSFTIKPKLTPSGAEAKITYSSSNKRIATVNAKGKVTAKKKGTATITVKAGNVTRTCVVTVK